MYDVDHNITRDVYCNPSCNRLMMFHCTAILTLLHTLWQIACRYIVVTQAIGTSYEFSGMEKSLYKKVGHADDQQTGR